VIILTTQSKTILSPPTLAPITATRSQDLPGTYDPIKTRGALFDRLEEAKSLGYLPAPARENKARKELMSRWRRGCLCYEIPEVVVCRRAAPLYGGWLLYYVQAHQAGQWPLAQLSRELCVVFGGLRRNKELWRTMPRDGELWISPGKGVIPFCNEDLAPLLAAWMALGGLFLGE